MHIDEKKEKCLCYDMLPGFIHVSVIQLSKYKYTGSKFTWWSGKFKNTDKRFGRKDFRAVHTLGV